MKDTEVVSFSSMLGWTDDEMLLSVARRVIVLAVSPPIVRRARGPGTRRI